MLRTGRLTDQAAIRAFLSADRGRYAYLLGDLAEPYWSHAEFYGAWREDQLCAVLLVYRQFDPPPVLPTGDPVGVAAILEAHLVGQLHRFVYHAEPDHLPLILAHYQTPEAIPMWRMVVTPERFQAPLDLDRVTRLRPEHNALSAGLYDSLTASDFVLDFHPATFDSGIFYGVIDETGRLRSVAGTHIHSPAERIGAVGFVYTHPAARGKSYATLSTGAVTRDLLASGPDLVALNVRQDNPPAIRAYEKLGYVRHSALFEGTAQR